jgi:hypothetical protein
MRPRSEIVAEGREVAAQMTETLANLGVLGRTFRRSRPGDRVLVAEWITEHLDVLRRLGMRRQALREEYIHEEERL